MTLRPRSRQAATFVAGLLSGSLIVSLVAGGIAAASIPSAKTKVIATCRNTKTGALRVIDLDKKMKCKKSESALSWNAQGVRGLPGAAGAHGTAGPQGLQGLNGAQGLQGPQGPQGMQGADGAQGTQGQAGPAGPSGPAGPAGTTGPAGPGYAYGSEIAVWVGKSSSNFHQVVFSFSHPATSTCSMTLSNGTDNTMTGLVTSDSGSTPVSVTGTSGGGGSPSSDADFRSATPQHYVVHLTSTAETIDLEAWVYETAPNVCYHSYRYLVG
jgi:hypothetical protein